MTEKYHAALKATGMMWEFYPHFTGNYDTDMRILKELRKLTSKKNDE